MKIIKNPIALIIIILAVIIALLVLSAVIVFGAAILFAFVFPIGDSTQDTGTGDMKYVSISVARDNTNMIYVRNNGGKDAADLREIAVMVDDVEYKPVSGVVTSEAGSMAKYDISTVSNIKVVGYFKDGSQQDLISVKI